MNKNRKTIEEPYFRKYVGTNVSVCPKQNKNNIKVFDEIKSNVVGEASLGDPLVEPKHINKTTSNNPTSNAAITLIALIITIIVLLILAGVTLNMVMGENGIFGKANSVKEQTQKSTAEETIKLAVLENNAKDAAGETSLNELELKVEISKKLKELGYTVAEDNNTVTYYEDKTINIEDFFEKDKSKTYMAYNVGELVNVGKEKFYVIKASSESDENITLLAEKNLDTITMKQTENADKNAFSEKNYWSNIEEITYPYDLKNTATSADTDVIAIVKTYGTIKRGEGRLLTLEEAKELGAINSEKNDLPDWLNATNFWLGSAGSNDGVWGYIGDDGYNSLWTGKFEIHRLYMADYTNNNIFGIRPVIEISKSLIS